ncbi:hypothetical protein ACLDYJ_13835, partial [Acinetobacter baumannii]
CGITHVRVSHRQLIILNTPISKEVGVFFYSKKSINKELLQRIIDTKRIRQNKNPIVFKK